MNGCVNECKSETGSELCSSFKNTVSGKVWKCLGDSHGSWKTGVLLNHISNKIFIRNKIFVCRHGL